MALAYVSVGESSHLASDWLDICRPSLAQGEKGAKQLTPIGPLDLSCHCSAVTPIFGSLSASPSDPSSSS